MSQELEAAEKGGVPALVQTPATEITAEDVALPRLYLGQYMSQHVQEDLVEPGSIYVALGGDDPDPQVLVPGKAGKGTPDGEEGVVFHVLALRKGKSISVDGELELYDYNDPTAPPEAWTTYNYVIALPTHDEDVPYKWLLTRTGRPAAQQINLVLKKNEARGPAYEWAFQVKTAYRENAKGKFYVPRVFPVEASDDNVKVAEKLAGLINSEDVEDPATSRNVDEPDI